MKNQVRGPRPTELKILEIEGIECDVLYEVRKVLNNQKHQDKRAQAAICDCLLGVYDAFSKAKSREAV